MDLITGLIVSGLIVLAGMGVAGAAGVLLFWWERRKHR